MFVSCSSGSTCIVVVEVVVAEYIKEEIVVIIYVSVAEVIPEIKQ